jgi:hypothetical protein
MAITAEGRLIWVFWKTACVHCTIRNGLSSLSNKPSLFLDLEILAPIFKAMCSKIIRSNKFSLKSVYCHTPLLYCCPNHHPWKDEAIWTRTKRNAKACGPCWVRKTDLVQGIKAWETKLARGSLRVFLWVVYCPECLHLLLDDSTCSGTAKEERGGSAGKRLRTED